MKKNRIVKKQEVRQNRKCRKQAKLLIWEKGIIRPCYRTRVNHTMAGIPRRIQQGKAREMMQLIWAREAANAALYADPWSWRI